MQNEFGLIEIGVNQVGFAPIGGAPSVLPNVPVFYSNTPKPGAAKQSSKSTTSASSASSAAGGGTDTSGSGGGDGSSGSLSTTSSDLSFNISAALETFTVAQITEIAAIVVESAVLATETTTTVTSSPTLASAAGVSATRMAPIGSGLVGTYIDASPMVGPSSGSIFLTAASPSQEILLGAQNEVLRIFDGLTPPTFEFLSNSSSLTDQGSITFSDGGRVDWGRWLPGFSVIDGGIAASTVGDFQYIFSQNITPTASIPLTGTALYSYVGGPAPADLNGVTGSILASTSLNVDFAQQFVTFNVGTLINGVTLTGSASGSIAAFIDPNSAIISPPTAAALVKANGFFVGPTAAGAITSFTILDNQSTNGATGTAVFAR